MKTCQTTMIGSMPQVTAAQALEALTEYPLRVPAWPQMPQRSFLEGMITQYSEGFPGIKVDYNSKSIWVERNHDLVDAMTVFYEAVVAEDLDAFGLSPTYATGLHTFLEEWAAAEEMLPIVKGQVTGPFTFGLGLCDQDRTPVWFDEQYRDIVYKGLGMKARWMIRELRKIAHEVILFFDESILSTLGTPAYMAVSNEELMEGLNAVTHAAHRADACVGIHCCGNMDWGLLAQTDVDIIAFDACDYGEKIALYDDEVKVFLERGGTLAYGLIPTLDPDHLALATPGPLLKLLKDLQQRFIDKGIPAELFQQQTILTPACGMGTLDHAQSLHVMKLLTAVAQRLDQEASSELGDESLSIG